MSASARPARETGRRWTPGGLLLPVLVLAVGGGAVEASPRQTPARPASQAAAADASDLRDMWLVIYNVVPDKTADFERIAARVRAAMAASPVERRRLQAAGLRIHRSAIPSPDGQQVYFLQIPTEPANDADRTGLDVLIDAVLPAEATALKAQLVAALDPRNPSGNTLMLALR